MESSRRRRFRIYRLEKAQQRWSRRGRSEKRNLLNYLLAVLRRAALPLFRIELDPAFSRELPSADSRAQRINWDLRALETPRTSADRSGVAKGVVISCAAIAKYCKKARSSTTAWADALAYRASGRSRCRSFHELCRTMRQTVIRWVEFFAIKGS